jgi:hypothetical protein
MLMQDEAAATDKPTPWSFAPASVPAGTDRDIANKLALFLPMWEGSGLPDEMVSGATPASETGIDWASPEPASGPKLDLVDTNDPEITFNNVDKPKPTTGFTFIAKLTPDAVPDWTPLAYDNNISVGGFKVRLSSSTQRIEASMRFTTAGTITLVPTTALVWGDPYFVFLTWSQGNDVEVLIYNGDGTLHDSASNATVGAGDTINWGSSKLWFFHQEADTTRHWNNLVDYVGYTDEQLTGAELTWLMGSPYGFFSPTAGPPDTLVAASAESASEVDAGSISQTHVIVAAALEAATTVQSPLISTPGTQLITSSPAIVAEQLIRESLRITDALGQRNRAEFMMRVEAGGTILALGETVELIDPTRGVRGHASATLFKGTVENTQLQSPKGSGITFQDVTLVDFNQTLDRFTVFAAYENMTAGAIIADIFTNASSSNVTGEGFTTVNVEDGPIIKRVIFNYQRVDQALRELADLTGFAYYVDYAKDVHFFDRTISISPLTIVDEAITARLDRGRDTYRNRQYVRAGLDLTSSRTEAFVGDGARKAFTLNFPVGKAPTVEVNSVGKTVGIRGLDDSSDWYWNKGDNVISQDDGDAALADTDDLDVTYQGLFPIIVSAENPAEIAARAAVEGGTGAYESVIQDASLDQRNLALDKANGLLRAFGTLNDRVTVDLTPSQLSKVVDAVTWEPVDLRAGDLLNVTITALGISDVFLVDEIGIRDEGGIELRASVELTSGESVGGWARWFHQLAKQTDRLVIRENELLVRLQQFTDPVALTDSIDIAVGGCDNTAGTMQVGFCQAG